MNIKKIHKLALSILTFSVCFGTIHAKTPNLIVILTDDQGYRDVGFNGCEDIPTPNIDTLANNGVIFREGYVSFPVCGPSRAGLLTGRYQDRFGYTTNPTIDPKNEIAGLPKEEENMAEVLTKVGYKSAIIGKWHMGSHISNHPLNRGFDYFYGFLSGGHNYMPEMLTIQDLSQVTRKWQWYSTKIMENHQRIEIDDYLTDELTDAANRYIDLQVQEDNPFFLYLAYNAPHAPLQATEKYLSRFPNIEDKNRRTYAAMVSSVDDGVGRVLDTLRRNGIEENTIVVFLSDNGGTTKNSSNNDPLKGFKSDLFEGGIRVPFAMQWKGTIPSALEFPHPVISLDIMSTITAQTNVQISKDRPLDGVNLIPYLTGQKSEAPHKTLFWRKRENDGMAIRSGDVKLVANTKYKNTENQLFNIKEDISEKKNLKSSQPEKSKQLLQEWENWNAQLKERYFPTLGKDDWWKKN